MSIPTERLIRLLNGILDVRRRGPGEVEIIDEATFGHWMRDGVVLSPDLDMEDVATLARIVSGERYEHEEPAHWRKPAGGTA